MNSMDVDTPISTAIELQLLRQSDNPIEKSNAEILTMLQELTKTVSELGNNLSRRIINIEHLVSVGLPNL